MNRGNGTLAQGTAAATRVRLVCVAVAIATFVMTGCGSSGGSSSTTVAEEPANTSARPGPPGVQGDARARFSGRSGRRKFLILANAVCSTVRSGTPPPPSGSSNPEVLHGYAEAAASVNQRTITSLERLGTPRPLRERIESLLASLRQLQAVYVQAGQGRVPKARTGSVRREMAMAEAATGSGAVAAGVPACAPHPTEVAAPPPRNPQPAGRGRT